MIKNAFITSILVGILFIGCEKNKDNKNNEFEPVTDSVSMGSNLIYDVFYTLNNGEESSVSSGGWDIAFRTSTRSSSILINEAAGVKLYEYSTDTTSWPGAFDTTGLYAQESLHNSTTDWELGAFSDNMTGHPNYGWGVYNMTTHDVIGTALFVIKLSNGDNKKLFIVKKRSVENKYRVRVADLDGNNEYEITLDLSPYTGKDFVYFTLSQLQFIDREPDKSTWDLLFTVFYDSNIDYYVSGILTAEGIKTMAVSGIDPELADTTMGTFSESIGEIAGNWKTFNMSTFQYEIADDLSFFMKSHDNKIYKLVIIDYEGRSTGKVKFIKTRIK